MPAAPQINESAPVTINSNDRFDYLRRLARSTEEEATRKTDDVSRLLEAAHQAQAEAKSLWAKVKELTRQADGFWGKAAVQNINGLLLEQLRRVRIVRKRLRKAKAKAKGKQVANRTGHLKELKEGLRLGLEDPRVSDELRKECVQELGEVALALAVSESDVAPNASQGEASKQSMQLVTQTHTDAGTDADTDADTDELQILDDTAEVRALFERKRAKGNDSLVLREPPDNARRVSAEHVNLAEQQILGELQASAIVPIRARPKPVQESHQDTGGAPLPQTSEQDRRLPKYKPTSHDVALGLRWTLTSCQTVRQDLNREIRDGGDQPYVAGHIAIMRRKVAILRYLAEGDDAPPSVIDEEIKSLENAISKAEPLVKPESVREANKYLQGTDGRNDLHQTLRFEGFQAVDAALDRKRKHEEDIYTRAIVSNSEQDTFWHRDKRRCVYPSQSDMFRHFTEYPRRKPQAPMQGAASDKSQHQGRLDVCNVGNVLGTRDDGSTGNEDDSTDREER